MGPMTQPNRMPIEGLKPKDLVGMPWRVAFALQADGWYLRSDVIWSKPNPMPESVTDRPTKSHEYIFLFSKSERYFYDAKAIAEPCVCTNLRNFTDGGKDKQRGHGKRHAGFNGRYSERLHKEGGVPTTRNRRDVWEVATKPFPEAHFATFPEDLIKPCVLSGCPPGGTVLDPFFGSGTTGAVARANDCNCIGIELNSDYIEIAKRRLCQDVMSFS
jgi:DNA modification methylase